MAQCYHDTYPGPCTHGYCEQIESLRARVAELERLRDEAFRMIVLLMNQREWGAATGALHEDSIVKAAFAAREAEGGE